MHLASFRNRPCLMHTWYMSVHCTKVSNIVSYRTVTVPVCFILFSVACMKRNTVLLELDIATCDL